MAVQAMLTAATLVGGVFPSTLVATPEGWRAAGGLALGDPVLTVGAGPLSLVSVARAEAPLWVQALPAGACGNRAPVVLPPGQCLLFEPRPGDLALIPAEALEGWRGVRSRPNGARPLTLQLQWPEMIYAGPGLILSLPGMGRSACPLLDELPLARARALVARAMAQDLGAALAQAARTGAGRE